MVQFVSRHNIEDCQLGDPLGVIERHTMADAPTAVVPHHGKLLEAEVVHDFYLILGRGALRVAEVILAVRRFATVAIAAEIGDNRGKIFSQPWRNLMPHHVSLRIPVEQQNRRSRAPYQHVDGRALGRDGGACESCKHESSPFISLWAQSRVRSQQTCVK